MGLDLYIEARIKEKKTGRCVLVNPQVNRLFDEDEGFFEICWWCGGIFNDIREKMIEISNRYAGTNYTDLDCRIDLI